MTPRTIPHSTIAALRELLLRMAHDEAQANEDGAPRTLSDVRAALRGLCDDARDHDVRAEQLVIAIKEGWSALQGDHPRTRAEGPDEALDRVISLCIDEFYAERETR